MHSATFSRLIAYITVLMLATAASAKPFPKNRLARHLLQDTEGDYDLVPTTGDAIPTTGGGDIVNLLTPTGDISQLVPGSLAGAVGAVAPIAQPIVSTVVDPALQIVSSCTSPLVSDIAGAPTPQGALAPLPASTVTNTTTSTNTLTGSLDPVLATLTTNPVVSDGALPGGLSAITLITGNLLDITPASGAIPGIGASTGSTVTGSGYVTGAVPSSGSQTDTDCSGLITAEIVGICGTVVPSASTTGNIVDVPDLSTVGLNSGPTVTPATIITGTETIVASTSSNACGTGALINLGLGDTCIDVLPTAEDTVVQSSSPAQSGGQVSANATAQSTNNVSTGVSGTTGSTLVNTVVSTLGLGYLGLREGEN